MAGPPRLDDGSGISGVGGIPDGVPFGVPDGVLTGERRPVPPPPPPPEAPPKPAIPEVIRVSEGVQAARLIHKVAPVYPSIAKQAGVSGVVKIEAIIARDGTIRKLEVHSGHPLLIKPAMDAVKQWRYRPTILNGEPVEVLTQVEVRFVLR